MQRASGVGRVGKHGGGATSVAKQQWQGLECNPLPLEAGVGGEGLWDRTVLRRNLSSAQSAPRAGGVVWRAASGYYARVG